jgi:hypothetical protein
MLRCHITIQIVLTAVAVVNLLVDRDIGLSVGVIIATMLNVCIYHVRGK